LLEGVKIANLALRFLLELCALVALEAVREGR